MIIGPGVRVHSAVELYPLRRVSGISVQIMIRPTAAMAASVVKAMLLPKRSLT
jgi:hypothetical protein